MFKVNGEGITDLIRQTWSEGRLSVALDLCEDTGAPKESHIDICTGKQKICGVGDLWLEPDNTTKHCGIDITLETTIKRLEDKYVHLHNEFANADLRLRYFTLRCDYAGIKYRNPKLEPTPPLHTYSKDELIIKKVGKELAELEPLFTILYPLIGKRISDLPYHRLTDDEIFEPELDHPYYLPNLKKNKDFLIGWDIDGKRTITGGIPVFPKKAIETESITPLTDDGQLPKLTDHITIDKEEIRPIVPEGLNDPYVDNAWISRDGDFYGDPRLSIGGVYVHIELAERLLENNIIPKSETMSPERYLEHIGWIKLSRGEVLFNPKDDIDYTSYQIETLKKYATIRELSDITIGYFGKKVKLENLDSLTHYKN